MTGGATQFHIGKRFLHAFVRFVLIHALYIASMTELAEVAEGVRLVPGFAIVANGLFALYFVAVLARRGLRAALCFGLRGGPKNCDAGKDERNSEDREPVREVTFHIGYCLLIAGC